LDQVTVGAVEVERDSKEAETGGQEKRGSKQVATEKGGGSKADKTSSTTADREKKVGEKKRCPTRPVKFLWCAQWLGFGALTAAAGVRFPVREPV